MHPHHRTGPLGHLRALALLAAAAVPLAACNDGGADKKPASQVAAKVNSGEISIHQINFLLERMQDVAPEKADQAKRQILNDLVDQELAVQQAIEKKLDRDPKVMQTIEAARREVLARAYMDQAVSGKNRPTPEEVSAYYREHPELFAERRIYRLQEIGFPGQPEVVAQVKELAEKSRRSDEVLNALRARGIPAAATVAVKPAENLPLEILPRLSTMKEGESGIFETNGRAALITVIKSTPEPMPEGAAKPVIEQYLARRHTSELVKATMNELRGKARIEYVGEFGKEAETERLAREAAEAREAKEAQAAREAARLARETESAKRAEEMRKARETLADKTPRQAPAADDGTISKGVSALK